MSNKCFLYDIRIDLGIRHITKYQLRYQLPDYFEKRMQGFAASFG